MERDGPKLTNVERYIISNQLRLLEGLYPNEADDIAIHREAIERGYEMLYAWSMEHIYTGSDIMTREESLEVWDTLDMFDAINRSIERLEISDMGSGAFTKFRGYDGNSETKFMSFAAFTVERLNRFEYVPVSSKGYWNSHMPVRDVYRRMLEVWRAVPRERRFELTKDELTEILEAAIHPENRPSLDE